MGQIKRRNYLDFNLKGITEEELKRLVILARNLENKRYRVLFFEADKPRTLAQNKFLRVIYNRLQEEIGMDPEAFHKEMKNMFGLRLSQINGMTYESAISTSDMNTVEMTEFIDKVQLFISETFNLEPLTTGPPMDEAYLRSLDNNFD